MLKFGIVVTLVTFFSASASDLAFDLAASLHEVEPFDVLVVVLDKDSEKGFELAELEKRLSERFLLLSVVDNVKSAGELVEFGSNFNHVILFAENSSSIGMSSVTVIEKLSTRATIVLSRDTFAEMDWKKLRLDSRLYFYNQTGTYRALLQYMSREKSGTFSKINFL